MLLKSIKLDNIRSYESEQIEFPSGSILLSGDIGCGKSSVLLAIEFAIFGAKKGELPGYTLLRHGKREGSVELRMLLEGKDVIIKRTLKRNSNDIKQEAGYIIVNGIKKEGTAEELRAIALEMLGYPKELIKKGKDMIYRYTVYTPQEEMKRILYESKDIRLDTIRKVFDIDKYKLIRDNARILLTSIREKKRHLEGFLVDLEPKKKEFESRKSEIREIQKNIEALQPKLDEVKKLISAKKESISQIESEIKELNMLRKELSSAESYLNIKIELNNRINEELKKLEAQIESMKKDLEGKELIGEKEISRQIDLKEKEIVEIDDNYTSVIRKIKGFEVRIEQCTETTGKISAIDICPLCEQKVDESHKEHINAREKEKHDKLVLEIRKLADEQEKLQKLKIEAKKELDILVKQENQVNVIRLKRDNLSEKLHQKDEKSAAKERIKKDIGELNAKKSELNSKIEKLASKEEDYLAVKKEIDLILPQERFLEIEKNKCETEIFSLNKFLARLEAEIKEKENAKSRLDYVKQLSNWIEEMFINLMSTMERHVMVSIHSQFDEVFKNWFGFLIEDESISVRIDEDFTPIIEQNGYETYIENLSGGEKTSVALSYRLALNKVINGFVSEIKTKDIIILDEPTDGFSSEQLDKVRDILNQLNMKQIILVSHESKIESFVDNIIRVQKRDNVSVVA